MSRETGDGSHDADVRMTSVISVGSDDRLNFVNPVAERTLLGADSRGHRLSEMLSQAARFGRISSVGISQLKRAIQAGTGSFHTEDGRTFVLHAHTSASATEVEWTDVSGFVAKATNRDESTGLPSRRGFVEALSAAGSSVGTRVLFRLSFDEFSDVLDQFGHIVTDHLIRRAADRIANRVDAARTNLAYAGNGEFLFVVESDQAEGFAEGLIEVLSRPYLVDGRMVNTTVSIGSALIMDGEGIENDLRNAGLALLKARSDGGNRNQTFTADMRESLERKKELELDLRRALALREFALVYQPQFKVLGRELVGFEALLRWNRSDRPVSPAEFVPLAEELGLIIPIGEWVLRTACKRAKDWPGHICISVNVSPLQFRSQGFVSMVAATLEKSGLDPARLDLEITEGALLLNNAPVMDTFQQLKALGVRFSMDDFGTGYSSLSYLQRFPFDKIKIDQSFVRSLPDKDSRAIIRAVCALGQTLGMTTIAEGVETEEQFSQIQKKGCHQVQGYLTGRPLSPDAADRLASTSPSKREQP